MKRHTYRRLRSSTDAQFHHHVYVVLLDPVAATDPALLKDNPKRISTKPCVYVGMTGLTPEERFQNHKQGIKASHWVKRYGLRLMPELYECLNPMPFEAAAQMERDLAADLKAQGYTVAGGT